MACYMDDCDEETVYVLNHRSNWLKNAICQEENKHSPPPPPEKKKLSTHEDFAPQQSFFSKTITIQSCLEYRGISSVAGGFRFVAKGSDYSVKQENRSIKFDQMQTPYLDA